MGINWVNVNARIYDLMDDRDLEPDEVSRDAKLWRRLALFCVFMVVALPALLSVAVRMLLNR